MDSLITMMMILVAIILALALVYTIYLTKQQKAVEGQIDSKIPKAVQEHVYLRNPVFLSYVLFFALVLLTIIFVALTFYR